MPQSEFITHQVESIDKRLVELRAETGKLEAALAALANGQVEPEPKRRPGRPRGSTTRLSTNGRRKATNGRGGRSRVTAELEAGSLSGV